MSSDTKWIIGTGISLAGVLLLAMLAQFSSMNSRIDDLGSRLDDLEGRFESRLDDLEGRFGSRLDDLEGRFESRLDDLQSVVRRMDERLRLVETGLAEVRALIVGDGGTPAVGCEP